MYTKCGGVAAYHVVCIGLCSWSFRVCVFLLVIERKTLLHPGSRVCVYISVLFTVKKSSRLTHTICTVTDSCTHTHTDNIM